MRALNRKTRCVAIALIFTLLIHAMPIWAVTEKENSSETERADVRQGEPAPKLSGGDDEQKTVGEGGHQAEGTESNGVAPGNGAEESGLGGLREDDSTGENERPEENRQPEESDQPEENVGPEGEGSASEDRDPLEDSNQLEEILPDQTLVDESLMNQGPTSAAEIQQMLRDGQPVILLSQDIDLGGVTLEVTQDVVFQAAANERITIFQSGSRHMKIKNPVTVTFDNVALDGKNSAGGIEVSAGDENRAAVENAVIQNCYNTNGGALKLASGNLTVRNSVIQSSSAGSSTNSRGGGAYVDGSPYNKPVLTLESSTVSGNSAREGGGVYVFAYGRLIAEESEISDNDASIGGGVYATTGAYMEMRGGQIAENQAKNEGGGIYLSAAKEFRMTGGSINGNYASNGAGMYSFKSNCVISDAEIAENVSTGYNYGGGLYISGSFYGENSVIRDNTAWIGGGAHISEFEGSVTTVEMDDVTFEGNSASESGGGIHITGGTSSFTGGKISGNRSEGSGGGMVIWMRAKVLAKHLEISHNKAVGVGAGVETNGVSCSFEADDTKIFKNESGSHGAGIYATSRETITIRNGWFSGNNAASGYTIGLVDEQDKLLHQNQIDVTSLSFPLDVENENHYAYNNYDISYQKGPLTLTVVYEANDGTGKRWVDHVSKTERYVVRSNEVTNFSRRGFRFAGWSLDAEGEANNLYLPEANLGKLDCQLILYAMWEEEESNKSKGKGKKESGVQLEESEVLFHEAYLAGYPDGTVRPNRFLTRAEAASVFFRLMDDSQRQMAWSSSNSYEDVQEGQWHNTAVSTMTKAGVVRGYPALEGAGGKLEGGGESRFKPDQRITRAEMAAILIKFTGGEESMNSSSFYDVEDSHWAAGFVEAAAEKGWITGYPDTFGGMSGSFRPEDWITRAEAASMINRMFQRRPETEEDLLPEMVTWPDNERGAWYYLDIQEASNSHDYHRKEDGIHETWVKLRERRNLADLERSGQLGAEIL